MQRGILHFQTLIILLSFTLRSTRAFFQGRGSLLCHSRRSFVPITSNPFLSSPSFLPSTMDDSFTHAVNRRMTALNSSKQKQQQQESNSKFQTNYKSKELKRLSQIMNLTVPQLKEALHKRRTKLDDTSEKAQYVDWLLTEEDKRKGSFDKVDVVPTQARKQQRVRPIKPTRSSKEEPEIQPPQDLKIQNSNAIQDKSLLSHTSFAQHESIHPLTRKALSQVLGLEYMTEIQSKTFTPALEGKDVLGRARTGTGKTVAFLLPALERLLAQPFKGERIGLLVVSPTRELASQIGDQAEKLLKFHKGRKVQVMYGGTKMHRDINSLNKKLPMILVATPGRLLDHLENTKLNGISFGRDVMKQTSILVLDETDRLLDMGFRREITKIMSYLARQEKRQTLLFSATVPAELKKIMSDNMRKDYIEVDCISDGGNIDAKGDGGAQHTNTMVEQSYVILPSFNRYVVSVVEIIHSMIADKTQNHKLVVFFPTARLVGYFAEFFNIGLGMEVIELHSRKSQSYRNTASDKFRNAKSAILFTSDVSARGVDYPDVTGVIQVSVLSFIKMIVIDLILIVKTFFEFSLVYLRIENSIFTVWEGQEELEKLEKDYWFWHLLSRNFLTN